MSRTTAIWLLVVAAVVVTGVVVGFTLMIDRKAAATPDTPLDQRVAPTATDPEPDDESVSVLAILPPFTLTDQSGAPYGLEQLSGQSWIANFMYTRCTTTCPIQTSQMAKIQEQLGQNPEWGAVRLVSISVDPKHDTPEVLHRYAQDARADPHRWHFLSGKRDQIWQLSREGFKMPVKEGPPGAAMPIQHSSKFVLIDGRARVRGYYDAAQAGLDELLQDLQRVLDEPSSVFVPADLINPPWLKRRRDAQLAAAESYRVFCGFGFVDEVRNSGITFRHRIVDESSRNYHAGYYDQGNGIAIADVDGDGREDIYFVNQVGGNELWRNLGGGRFENITETAGVAVANRISVSASFADIDNDGDQDLYVTAIHLGNVLFENDGHGRFKDVSQYSGLDYEGHSGGAVFFDFDRDGLLDLFLANVGRYTTERQVRVIGYSRERKTGEYWYYIGTKYEDGNYLKRSRAERSVLFRQINNTRFLDMSDLLNLVDRNWTGDAAAADLNDDGWTDLYVLNMHGHDEYYENVAGSYFRRKSRDRFRKTPWGSTGIKVFDFDNDGQMDIFITDMHSDRSQTVAPDEENRKSEMSHPERFLHSKDLSIYGNAFYLNGGNGRFRDVSDRIGAETFWPWGLSVGDLNADGYDDAFITSGLNYPNRYGANTVLLNDRGRTFLDSTFVLGIEPRRDGRTARPWCELDCTMKDRDHPECKDRIGRVVLWGALGSRSSVIFDLDNDGDLDIVTNEFNDRPMVLISNLSEKRTIHFLKVKLIGTKSNRNGLGAKVEVRCGPDVYTKFQDGQSGYLSHSIYPLYFGLGDSQTVNQIRVRWPSGQEQVVEGPIEVNALITVTEEENQ